MREATAAGMRLACGDTAFPLLPHELAVEVIARMGFEGFDVTLTSNSPHLRTDVVMEDVPRWAAHIEELVTSRGMQIADVMCLPAVDFATMAVNSTDPAERERGERCFRAMLELSRRCGSRGLTMLPGVDWPTEDHATSLRRAATELDRRARIAHEHGVRFSVEPHVGSVCAQPRDVEALCEMAPELELTLDYSHFIVQGFAAADVEPLLARARHVHARGATRERLQASFRSNVIDYDRVVDALKGLGYEGFIAVEYMWIEWAHLNEVDVVSETVVMRDAIRARIAGTPWRYPDPGGVHETAIEEA